MAQLMPLPLTVSCFSKIQMGFAFLVLAHLGSPGKRAVKQVCVCVYRVSKMAHAAGAHTHTHPQRSSNALAAGSHVTAAFCGGV